MHQYIIIIIYSITNRNTFNQVDFWKDKILRSKAIEPDEVDEVPPMYVLIISYVTIPMQYVYKYLVFQLEIIVIWKMRSYKK